MLNLDLLLFVKGLKIPWGPFLLLHFFFYSAAYPISKQPGIKALPLTLLYLLRDLIPVLSDGLRGPRNAYYKLKYSGPQLGKKMCVRTGQTVKKYPSCSTHPLEYPPEYPPECDQPKPTQEGCVSKCFTQRSVDLIVVRELWRALL